MFKKNKKAFTLMEVLTVLTVIGVVASIVMYNLASSDTLRLKKIASYSVAFYNDAVNVFQGLLMQETNNGYSLAYLNDLNNDKAINATDIAIYFSRKMSGDISAGATDDADANKPQSTSQAYVVQNTSCKNLKIATGSEVADYAKNAVCVDFNHVVAGFVYDAKCGFSIKAKEYISNEEVTLLSKDHNAKLTDRSVNNACGYIIYNVGDADGIYKEDLFVIPFSNRGLK